MKSEFLEPLKDAVNPQPVAGVWQPTLKAIVDAFADGDYALSRGIESVDPVSKESVEQISGFLAQYPEKLIGLPGESWNSSVAQWINPHWEVFVDLWTAEAGRSDLILHAHVHETQGGYRFVVHAVYVP